MIRNKITITLFFVATTFSLFSLCAEAATKIITYYDVGSSGTKYAVYRVDLEKGDHKKLFNDMISVHYSLDLETSGDDTFSEAIKAKGVHVIQLIKEYVNAKYGQSGEVGYYGVATAAWRNAKNGEQLQNQVYEVTGVAIKIITQKEEAELGYEGVVDKVHRKDIVVWDIGGGSMQFVTKDDKGDFITTEGKLAAQTFTNKVREHIKHISQYESPNPMHAQEIDQAIALAKANLGFNAANEAAIKRIIASNGGVVYGISPLHKFVVPKTLAILTGLEHKEFTRADLKYAIEQLTNKGDDVLAKYSTDRPDPEFTKNHLTALILVYATMEKMGVEKVITTETSSIDGLAARGPEFVLKGF